MAREDNGRVAETFFAKLMVSLLMAVGMYWMRIPHQVELLMMMQGIDLFMGVLVAWLEGEFKAKTLGRGIMLKSLAYLLLAACDLTEEPLRLSFHVDAYVALALVSYEFLSIVESYSRVRPLPRFVAASAKQVREWISTPDLNIKKVKNVTERFEIETPAGEPNIPVMLKTTTEELHEEPVKPDKEQI
jgi:phage-related holin